MRYRLATGLVGVGLLAMSVPPVAADRLPIVAPGDRITIASAATRTVCTLGWTYTANNGRVYGLTAGHCTPGQIVRVTGSGARGQFAGQAHDTTEAGAADYALVDFGRDAINYAYLENSRTSITDRTYIDTGVEVCRTGVTTGTHCGEVSGSYGRHQFLTSGMSPSAPGDSGGPVWRRISPGRVEIVGIWLGWHTSDDGTEYGRFVNIRRAFEYFGVM